MNTIFPFDERIGRIKQQLGPDLCILAHHYQHDAIVKHADAVGDSLELARQIPSIDARYIVFCGVFFMAESAALLTRPGQQVLIPARGARCIMSEMAPAELVDVVLRRLQSTGRRILPLTYVNSSAAVKSICGEHGGAVCTSANAAIMLSWALEQSDAVLFLPDRNLGWNTADRLALPLEPENGRLLLDIRRGGENLDPITTSVARLLLWPGCCATHNRFKRAHIDACRRKAPGVRIVVHPECRPEIVQAADASGSTSFIIRYADEAPAGATVAIGTEINLVDRLGAVHAPGKTVIPLMRSACSNMAKSTPEALITVLDDIVAGNAMRHVVTVPPALASTARVALERMLKACAQNAEPQPPAHGPA